METSVSLDDAKKAVAEAKHHAKQKSQSAIQQLNKTWSERLSATSARHDELQSQADVLTQQNKQLAAQVQVAEDVAESRNKELQQLAAQVAMWRQRVQALETQIQQLKHQHAQEINKVCQGARHGVAALCCSTPLDCCLRTPTCSTARGQLCLPSVVIVVTRLDFDHVVT